MGNSSSTIDAVYDSKSAGDTAYNYNAIKIANGVRLISRMGDDYVEMQKHKNLILNQQTSKINRQQHQIQQQQQEIDEYKQEIDEYKQEIDEYKQEIDECKQEIHDQQERLGSKDAVIKNQQNTIILLQQQLASALKSKDTAIKIGRETRRLSIVLTTQYEEKVQVLEDKVDEKEQHLQKSERKTEELMANLDEKEEEIITLECMNELAKDEHEEFEKEIQKLTESRDNYVAKYNDCNTKLKAAMSDKPKKEDLIEAGKVWHGLA